MQSENDMYKDSGEFATPSELRTAVPRRVKYTARVHWIRRGVWNLALALACTVSAVALRDIVDLTNLAQHGLFVDAYVITSEKLDDNGPRYYYGYSSDRHSYKEDGHVIVRTEEGVDPLDTWDPIQITFLPSDPSQYRFGRVGVRQIEDLRLHWVRVAIWWSIPFLIWISRLEFLIARQRRLLRYGRTIPATLTGKSHCHTSDGSFRSFAFSYSANGTQYSGWTSTVPERAYERYSEGERFTLLVDRTEPRRNLPYLSFTDVVINGTRDSSFDELMSEPSSNLCEQSQAACRGATLTNNTTLKSRQEDRDFAIREEP